LSVFFVNIFENHLAIDIPDSLYSLVAAGPEWMQVFFRKDWTIPPTQAAHFKKYLQIAPYHHDVYAPILVI